MWQSMVKWIMADRGGGGQQLAAMGNIELFCTYPIWKYSTVRTVLPLLGAVLRMNSDANGLEGRHETGIGGG